MICALIYLDRVVHNSCGGGCGGGSSCGGSASCVCTDDDGDRCGFGEGENDSGNDKIDSDFDCDRICGYCDCGYDCCGDNGCCRVCGVVVLNVKTWKRLVLTSVLIAAKVRTFTPRGPACNIIRQDRPGSSQI